MAATPVSCANSAHVHLMKGKIKRVNSQFKKIQAPMPPEGTHEDLFVDTTCVASRPSMYAQPSGIQSHQKLAHLDDDNHQLKCPKVQQMKILVI